MLRRPRVVHKPRKRVNKAPGSGFSRGKPADTAARELRPPTRAESIPARDEARVALPRLCASRLKTTERRRGPVAEIVAALWIWRRGRLLLRGRSVHYLVNAL